MLEMRTILHPTDFSPASEYAFRLACALARDHGAKVVLLHVAAPAPAYYGPLGAAMVPPETVGSYHETALEALRRLHSPVPEVEVEPLLCEGDEASEILRVARDHGCDLIVMGTHGRSGLPRLLLGSVAEKVMRRASCPVVTAKPPLAEETAEEEGSELQHALRAAATFPHA